HYSPGARLFPPSLHDALPIWLYHSPSNRFRDDRGRIMTMTSPAWDPHQYNRFERQRDRAAIDLLSHLPDDLDPHEVWDIGCGTGQHAALLKRRWPGARVHGLDSSAAMLEQARGLPDDVRWVQGDLQSWAPDAPVDLILANASLQWAQDHAALFRRMTEALAPGGVLA